MAPALCQAGLPPSRSTCGSARGTVGPMGERGHAYCGRLGLVDPVAVPRWGIPGSPTATMEVFQPFPSGASVCPRWLWGFTASGTLHPVCC